MKKTLQVIFYEERIHFSLFKMWDCVENDDFDGAMYFQFLYLHFKSTLRKKLSRKTFYERMRLTQIALFGNECENVIKGN